MPTRYLKPGIRDSELIDSLSPMAEVMFYRLLVTVDDYGRFDARPAMIKSQCFPIKDKITPKHCEDAIKELCEVGLLMAYVANEKPYLQILKWDNVPRSKESRFPEYSVECVQLYTDVCNSHTVLPVTVTVTVTKTETKTETKNIAPPDGVALSVWQDFQKTRKTKVTETALNGIRREAEKAGITLEAALNECCARGWQSFKADWVNKAQSTNETTYQRSMREKWETVTGRNSTLTEVYDVTPLALD